MEGIKEVVMGLEWSGRTRNRILGGGNPAQVVELETFETP